MPADWPGLQEEGGERAESVIVSAARLARAAEEKRRPLRQLCPPLVGVGRGWKTGPLPPAGLRAAAAAVPRACRAAVGRGPLEGKGLPAFSLSRSRPRTEPRRHSKSLFPLFCRFASGIMAQRAFPNPYADYNKSLAESYFDSTGRVS